MPLEQDWNENLFEIELERHALTEALRHEFGQNINFEDIENIISQAMEDCLNAGEVIENYQAFAHLCARRRAIKHLRIQEHERPINEFDRQADAHDAAYLDFEAEDMYCSILARMQPNYREVIELLRNDCDAEEIAELKGIEKENAYKQVQRARKLYKELEKKLGTLPPPAIIRPNRAKINRKNLELECPFSRGIWHYTVSACFKLAPRAIARRRKPKIREKSRQ